MEPPGHREHVDAAETTLKRPVGHKVHAVAPMLAENDPARHVVHAVVPFRFDMEPTVQLVQLVAPGVEPACPARHCEHNAAPGMDENSPARHVLQAEAAATSANVPTGQVMHVVDVLALKEPLGHAVQLIPATDLKPMGHITHDEEPLLLATEPGSQSKHVTLPDVGENVAAGHSLQVNPSSMEPAGH